jgi:hypothetical protein
MRNATETKTFTGVKCSNEERHWNVKYSVLSNAALRSDIGI